MMKHYLLDQQTEAPPMPDALRKLLSAVHMPDAVVRGISRVVGVLDNPGGYIEMAMSILLLGLGTLMIATVGEIPDGSMYLALSREASASVWAVVFGFTGGAMLAGIWTASPTLRRMASLAACGIWGFMTMFMVSEQIVALTTVIMPWLLFTTAWIHYRQGRGNIDL